jgi:folate-binding protein YgfZ
MERLEGNPSTWPASAVLIALPPAPDCPRAMVITPSLDGAHQPQDLASPELWAWAQVASGIAHVDAVGSEAFVPQMLNYESVGGVNFKKGCYPGQEVVARSQFRGAIKRRTVRACSTAPMPPGTEIFQADNEREPVGVVVNSAVPVKGESDHLALVCLHTEVLHSESLRLGTPQGPALTLLGLPYPLLEDI